METIFELILDKRATAEELALFAGALDAAGGTKGDVIRTEHAIVLRCRMDHEEQRSLSMHMPHTSQRRLLGFRSRLVSEKDTRV